MAQPGPAERENMAQLCGGKRVWTGPEEGRWHQSRLEPAQQWNGGMAQPKPSPVRGSMGKGKPKSFPWVPGKRGCGLVPQGKGHGLPLQVAAQGKGGMDQPDEAWLGEGCGPAL